MAEDWRVTVDLAEGHNLAADLDEHELEEEARSTFGNRIAVSGEGAQLFLYADTRPAAEQAIEVVQKIVERGGGRILRPARPIGSPTASGGRRSPGSGRPAPRLGSSLACTS